MSSSHQKSSVAALTVAAIGIVYGDIGTSPLYTLKTIFSAEHGLPLTHDNLLGAISLILWGLIIVVSLKYVTLMLRADNRGEGGILSLLALTLSSVTKNSKWYFPLMLVGLFGATLFFGDAVITPAISVLGAVEGLSVATPTLTPYVLPLAVVILVGLYSLQWHGTAGIGRWFGPVMILWFATLAAMGIVNIVAAPEILKALNPLHALNFMQRNGYLGFLALGGVVLALTGAEALYADMGHFGRKPIRIAWFAVAFPALALNYLGQGGLLMHNPAAVSNPFYNQLGAWSVYPLVALATAAAIIASQATISGTFSIVKEAMALGFLPRMRIVHTSAEQMGQIYLPVVNWIQLAVVLGAVIGFGNSDNMAAAYGIAVTLTMMVTTMLTFFVVRYRWHYSLWIAFGATGFFLALDILLVGSNVLKILHGGWFPLAMGSVLFFIMLTWKRGHQLVYKNLQKHAIPLEDFLQSLFIDPPTRVYGTAVFLRPENDGVPHVLLHNLLHNKVLHERVVFLTMYITEDPWVPPNEQVKIIDLGHQCYQLNVYYGFKDEPDLPKVLEQASQHDMEFAMMETSFFIARQTLLPRPGGGMALWREHIFAGMFRNARSAADYYQIPPNRVIELGTQVEI